MAKKFVVTMKRGFSRSTKSQRATMEAIGLSKRHQSVEMADNPANRGQIMKVQHLVEVKVQG